MTPRLLLAASACKRIDEYHRSQILLAPYARAEEEAGYRCLVAIRIENIFPDLTFSSRAGRRCSSRRNIHKPSCRRDVESVEVSTIPA